MLVDDHEVVREGLKALLEAEADLEIVAEAGDAEQAVLRARSHKPDVVVMDVRMPGRSGVEACRDIRSERPETAVLFLTTYSDDQALFDAIMAGAAGYVLKQIRGNELVEGVRRVAAGDSLLDPKVTAKVLDRIRHPQGYGSRLARLTPTELRILEMLADGLTNRQIGEQVRLAEKTVKNYVSAIFSKLGVSRRAEAAAYLVGHRPQAD
jgi:DNA-binding NarL/FixJ family response regulator